MQRQLLRDTEPEVKIRRLLHRRGYRYRVDRRVLAGLRRRADIVFPTERIAVFVDGCFWHGCPDHATQPKSNAEYWREKLATNRARDADTDRRLEQAGWVALRVWEHEEPEHAVDRIVLVIESRRNPETR